MVCPQCQKQNQEGAKFCPYCGYSYEEIDVNIDREKLQRKEYNRPIKTNITKNNDGEQMQVQTAPSQAQKESFFNHFATFFVNGLKKPTQYAKHQGGARVIFGYIILVLSALFYGLAIAMVYIHFDRALSFFGGASYSFISSFFTYLLINLAVLTLAVGLIFVFVKNFMKINVDFNHIVGRFGTLAIILLLCNVLTFLFALIGLTWLQSYASGISNAVLYFIVVLTIQMYTQETKEQFEPLYGSLIIAATVILLNSLFSTTIFSNLFF